MSTIANAAATNSARRNRSRQAMLKSASLTTRYMDKAGVINVGRLAEALFVSRDQLAKTAEMLEILDRIEDWAGGEAQALAWYRSQPIPALDSRTAEALVQSGNAALVRSYLDHLALGGFA
jgi:uncharacterized protein (DUF2384 family)